MVSTGPARLLYYRIAAEVVVLPKFSESTIARRELRPLRNPAVLDEAA
jgi:hypothetical protein